jgi:cytochrome P450
MSITEQPTCPFAYPSPEVIENPFPFYAWLRSEAPVFRLDDGSFLVSRWDDIAQIVRHPEIYSNKIGPLNDQILGGPRLGGDASGPWPTSFADLPELRPQRVISSLLVTRERLESYEPIMLRKVDELIDSFAASGAIEFRSAFASLLPRRVMMDIFGFPAEDEPDFIRWASGQGPVGSKLASPEERVAEQRNRLELAGHFEQHILARVDAPRDDFLTVFVQALIERDGAIDMPYAQTELVNLFAAGNGTTAHMLASALLLLLEHPAELERVRADPSLIPAMLEETIRLEGPIQWNQRVATQDVVLHGVPIPAGSLVLISWAAANRDESKFAEPDRFEIDRPGLVKQHLAYGQGIHKCLGVLLARLEGRIAMQRLLERLPNLRLAVPASEVRHIPNLNQRSPAALQIEFDPS